MTAQTSYLVNGDVSSDMSTTGMSRKLKLIDEVLLSLEPMIAEKWPWKDLCFVSLRESIHIPCPHTDDVILPVVAYASTPIARRRQCQGCVSVR